MKKALKWVAVALALTLVAVWAIPALLGNGGQATEPYADYSRYMPTRSSLQVEVTGNGYVRSALEKTMYAPVSAKVDAVHVKNGDSVTAGQVIATLDDETLEAQILAAKNALDQANKQLRNASLRSEERKINAPVSGKVKYIASKGADVSQVSEAYGALAYISKDEKMQVTLAAVPGIETGVQVTLKGATDTIQATVQSARNAQNNTVLIVEGDDWLIQRVSALYQGEVIGEGLLLPHRGIPVLGSYGTIKKLDSEENASLSSSAALFTLEKDYGEATLALFAVQQDAQRAYDTECAKREELLVRAPFDGAVSDLMLKEGESIAEGRAMFTLHQEGRYEVVAAIDELDIALIEAGLSATVTMDAVKGSSIPATVQRKAAVGNFQNGVTTYDVTLSLSDGEGVMSGMSAETRIYVAQRDNALLLPKSLIAYRDGKPYVTTEQGETAVTLGLASKDQVEILSGLTDGQAVLVKPEKVATGFAAMQNMGQTAGQGVR